MPKAYIKSGKKFSSTEENISIDPQLPPSVFMVKQDPKSGEFYLEQVEDFSLPKKMYGNVKDLTSRIMTTFLSRDNSTGVLLCGEKGSGKTMQAKALSIACQNRNMPTIIINSVFEDSEAFQAFIQSITQPAVILFDEFEKVYDRDDQLKILTLLDGVFATRKLFILTCNDEYAIDKHMKNRPGRIFYSISYTGLEKSAIVEYCNDILNNKQHTDSICTLSCVFEAFNFDMLQALVEEMNRFNESPEDALKMLNIKISGSNSNSDYNVDLIVDGKPIDRDDVIDGHEASFPVGRLVTVQYRTDSAHIWSTVTFLPEHLVSVDSKRGVYEFRNGKNAVKFSKVQTTTFSPFNYNGLLA